MRKQGAILLGNGGDNSNGSQGTFYEGVMTTAGYPSDATEKLVQANVVAAKYDVQRVSLAPPPSTPDPVDDPAGAPASSATRCRSTRATTRCSCPTGSSATCTTSRSRPGSTRRRPPPGRASSTSARAPALYMFLATSAGSTPRFAITDQRQRRRRRAGHQRAVRRCRSASGRTSPITLSGTTARMYFNGVQVAQNTNMTLTPVEHGQHDPELHRQVPVRGPAAQRARSTTSRSTTARSAPRS